VKNESKRKEITVNKKRREIKSRGRESGRDNSKKLLGYKIGPKNHVNRLFLDSCEVKHGHISVLVGYY